MHPFPARRVASLGFILGVGALPVLSGACRRSDAPRVQVSDVERCERGVDLASVQPTLREALRVYYRECANVYSEPECRLGFMSAAEAEQERQSILIAEGCRKAYCPILPQGASEMCQPSFQSTKEAVDRAWPKLHQAILEHDGKGFAPRITRVMVAFYARVRDWPKPGAASAGSAEPTEAAPAASGGGAGAAAPATATAARGAAAASAAASAVPAR